MEYARDVTVIETPKVSWTEGKVVGFYPMTLFYKEETGNKGYKAPVSFFQSFGFREVPWRSIDEYYLPEATLADIYQYGWEGNKNLDWTILAEIDEGPSLSIVRDWSSYINYEDFHAEEERERDRRRNEELRLAVLDVCHLCRAAETLYFWRFEYIHNVGLGYVRCAAASIHEELGTNCLTAWKFSRYRVLRDYLESYSKLNSSKRLIRSHSAYLHLVDLGREAALFIMSDIKEGWVRGVWSLEALADITGNKNDLLWWRSFAESQAEAILA